MCRERISVEGSADGAFGSKTKEGTHADHRDHQPEGRLWEDDDQY